MNWLVDQNDSNGYGFFENNYSSDQMCENPVIRWNIDGTDVGSTTCTEYYPTPGNWDNACFKGAHNCDENASCFDTLVSWDS